MDIRETIKLFLPKYLSPEDKINLSALLEDFPDNLDERFYSDYLKNEKIVFQGDGISKIPISNFPNTNIQLADCIITSNTCDLDLENSRLFPSRLVYAPIINLRKYKELYEKNGITKDRIDAHINAVKRQEITQIFYLPRSKKSEESLVFLDRLNNCSNDEIDRDDLPKKRLFVLSNYGFYVFLIKLSMSFSRIAEKVNRN